MKKFIINILSILSLLLVFAFSCEEKDRSVIPQAEGRESLTGSWLLYEKGLSPGSGYITKNIPSLPPQVITFHDNGSLFSTVNGLDEYKFYLVLNDPTEPDNKILALFKTMPSNEQDTSHLEHSYFVTFAEGRLRLAFRWCIEGCHLAFKPID